MTFGQPWLLLGAMAALIPLAVHLFDRRKPRPHPFAAIAFVLRSQRRTASRLKLNDWNSLAAFGFGASLKTPFGPMISGEPSVA